MKKLSVLFLSFVMLFVFATGAQAQTAVPSVKILLDEEQLAFTGAQPFIEKGNTLIPVKPFLEKLGYELSWDAETSTLHAAKGELSFVLERDSDEAMANNEGYKLNVAPKIVNGTLYASLRFLAENAGYRIGWDSENRAAALEQQDSKGFFWKVEKDGSVVYLLGSIHVGNEVMYPMRPEINAAYGNSDHLVVEINIAAPMDEQTVADIQKYMTYADGSTLKEHIDAESYTKLQEILKEVGVDETAFDTYKPWAVSNQLTVLKSALGGYETGLGIDMYFLQKAMITGKSILELESYDSQFSMFNNFSEEFTASMLKETIAAYHQPDNTTGTMAKMWVDGDDAASAELTNAMKELPEYYKGMIGDRNEGMIEKVEGYLADENKDTYFVVAGYLHMLGDDGIITKLQEKGYTITRQ